MISEGLLWFGAWILFSEIIFIFWIIKDEDFYWYWIKGFSFAIGLILIWSQIMILDPSLGSCTNECSIFPNQYNWINIFYELIVIGSITALFSINKHIANSIKRIKK